ncbi:MAG: hypothetical protein R2844_08240 [Caldilineales bacterium]
MLLIPAAGALLLLAPTATLAALAIAWCIGLVLYQSNEVLIFIARTCLLDAVELSAIALLVGAVVQGRGHGGKSGFWFS